MAAILPGKFDDGDFEFDACSAANGWQVTEDEDKILKLPAFLRGRAASNYYAIPEGERRTYKDAVKSMRRALCPAQAKRENFFAEFAQRHLRPEEDPSVYKWELENVLTKADPSLSNDAKLRC